MMLRVEAALDRLGPEWDALFEAGAGVQTSRAWFAATAEAALPQSAAPEFVGVSDAVGPLALLAMTAGGGCWQSMTTPYTCLWQPLLRPGLAPDRAEAALALAFRQRRHAVTRLEALDPGWPGMPALLGGIRAARLLCRRFDHFANWYAPVGEGWEAYLQARPGALRETIRRKLRALDRGGVRIDVAASPEEVARLLPAYEAVYASSWKQPEPFPRFNQAMLGHVARAGGVRVFVMWSGDRAVAAQYWTVADGCATVLKLAHDEREKRLSPGTVLTATAIRHLIERDRIRELDFGRGDDPYKRSWTGDRRQRIGLLVLDAASWRGLATMARHDLGRLRRSLKRGVNQLPVSSAE